MYTEIKKCRICGNAELDSVLHLGEQHLTGVFPSKKDQQITAGPMELVKCRETASGETCGLLQLKHSYDLNEMYGLNYGYRSGLNRSMVEHLRSKVAKICRTVTFKAGDLIIDIGSNDSTLLQGYPTTGCQLVGIDPTGVKFEEYYPSHIQLIPEFFSAGAVQKRLGSKKAKVISSIAMFYDLESPIDFMKQILEVLADDGIWVFEQSYMPTMLDMNAYDTVCHEHLEYYGLKQIKWMTDRVGLKIIDIELNNVNGGSFSLMVAKRTSTYPETTTDIKRILDDESARGLHTLKPYREFNDTVYHHRDKLCEFLSRSRAEGKTVLGYGASTKGNVILQFCKITTKEIPFIAEVNQDKFGCFTPGSLIPIISEAEARAMKPAYFMVLPWHFRDGIVLREKAFVEQGGKLLFPLPSIEVVG